MMRVIRRAAKGQALACLALSLSACAAWSQEKPASPSQTPPATSPQTPAQTTPQTPAQQPPPQLTPGFVTNAFVDTDIKVAISESAAQAGVTVVVDDSIKPLNISVEFKNTPIRQVLDRLALFVGGVWKEKSEGL